MIWTVIRSRRKNTLKNIAKKISLSGDFNSFIDYDTQQAGYRSGDEGAKEHDGQIGKDRRGAGDEGRAGQLPDMVQGGAGHRQADGRKEFGFMQ